MGRQIGIEATVHDCSDILLSSNSGQRLLGLVKDNTGKIEFIAWGPNAGKTKAILHVGSTYKFHPVKVATFIPRFVILHATFRS